MKTVIQRVSRASVTIDNKNVANILHGMLVLLGIEESDTQEDINWLSNKIINLRIFDDQNGVMNNSLLDNQGDVIVVSQFTLTCINKERE
jgi:D-tyrosyl-tRNA(Tyr) deacylase